MSIISFQNESEDLHLDLNGDREGVNYETEFTSENQPITSSQLTLTGNENTIVTGSTITITNLGSSGLEILATNTEETNIQASYNSGTGVLTLTGQDSLERYQRVLRQVTYSNPVIEQEETPRVIEFLVTGLLGENELTSTAESTVSFPELEFIEIIGNRQDNNLVGTVNNDSISGRGGNDTINGLDGNDILLGEEDNDILLGEAGNDTLEGGEGEDTLEGDIGNDLYRIDSAGDVINEASTEPLEIDTVEASVDYQLGSNLENLLLTSERNLNGTGNTLNNQIEGNDGNNSLRGEGGSDTLRGNEGQDTLDGGNGVDSLVGGAGNDLYIVDNLEDIIEEERGDDVDTITALIDYSLTRTRNIENLILGGSGPLTGEGNEEANEITGNDADNRLQGLDGNDTIKGQGGNDTLAGGSGEDRLEGGSGNDTYIVDNQNDEVIETSDDPNQIDTVQVEFSYTLGDNLENLVFGGRERVEGRGNQLNNSISGNRARNELLGLAGNDTLDGGAGDDTLDGGSGNDTLIGQTGNDTYLVDNPQDVIQETSTVETEIDEVFATSDYVLSANLENLYLEGDNRSDGEGNNLNNLIVGTSLRNILRGSSGNDTLRGEGGNDTLDGGVGDDELIGSRGNDFYIVDSAGDVVQETRTAGNEIDTVQTSLPTYTLGDNLENLLLQGPEAFEGIGNELDNQIIGNEVNNLLRGEQGDDLIEGRAGDDTLNGGPGRDSLLGGQGNDTYIIDDGNDLVSEVAEEGNDAVIASIDYTLPDEVEILTQVGTARIRGRGNSSDNTLTGNRSRNLLEGRAGNDTLDGAGGDDTLEGGRGNDNLIGGAGNDTYVIENVGDVISELSTEPTEIDLVLSNITYTLGANLENLTLLGEDTLNGTGNLVNNLIIGNVADNVLQGGDGDDTLQAEDGNDRLVGGLGADSLLGGRGNDIYQVDDEGDIVVEEERQGNDTVESLITYTLVAEVENLTLLGSGEINGSGNNLTNSIKGNNANNLLEGLGADDTIEGFTGDDTIDGGSGADRLIGGEGNDTYLVDDSEDVVIEEESEDVDSIISTVSYTLPNNVESLTLSGTDKIRGTGNALNNTLVGNRSRNRLRGRGGNDTLDGAEGDDILNGGEGNDSMIGGIGSDTYFVNSAGDVIQEIGPAGDIDTVVASFNYTLGENLENLTLEGEAELQGNGNTLDNQITGNSANNILNGAEGNDTISGAEGDDNIDGGVGNDSLIGRGNDTYIVDSTSDVILEEESEGDSDLVLASATYTLSDNIENLTLTGDLVINGTGNSLDNKITGNQVNNTLSGDAGNDTLDGAGGDDRLAGGAGNDIYLVDSVSDVVVETEVDPDEIDEVRASVEFTLADNVEILTLTGNQNLNGTGNEGNNQINGNQGSNNLAGAEGNDTLIGAEGDDTLDGGLDRDRMVGGTGNDTYLVDNRNDEVVEDSGEANEIDTVITSVAYTLGDNLEILISQGTANLELAGNRLNNRIVGNDGNNVLNGERGQDTLEGGLGNDTLDGGRDNDSLIGGLGNDTYIVNSPSDVIVEDANPDEIDEVLASITYTLGANLENLTLTGTESIDGTGNNLNNILTGNEGNNRLNGATGDDTLIGAAGNDTYVIDSLDDVIDESSGTEQDVDTIEALIDYTLPDDIENLTLIGTEPINGTGNGGPNLMIGNSAGNTLTGGRGNDTLDGGVGSDTLIGDSGDDLYRVDNSADIIQESSNDEDEIDTVEASTSYALSDNLEILVLVGNGNIEGSGNSLSNEVIGNGGNNILNGNAGNDTLEGAGGNDELIGGDGRDRLLGGAGTDIFTGNAGADLFIFNNPSEGPDQISDYVPFDDTISVSASGFGGGLEAGQTLTREQFALGPSATTSEQRFIYNKQNGSLFFDEDGSGPSSQILFASLTNRSDLTNDDIVVF